MGNNSEGARPLPERVKEFYELVSSKGAEALPLLPTLYAPDIHFINPVVDQRGLDKFTKQWVLALKEYKTFEFVGIEVTGDDQYFTMTYKMNIAFAIGPVFPSQMATACWARDGKVFRTRDYFDVVGSLLAPFPLLDCLYKKIFSLLVA